MEVEENHSDAVELHLVAAMTSNWLGGRMPFPLQPEMAYWGEKISAGDTFRPCSGIQDR